MQVPDKDCTHERSEDHFAKCECCKKKRQVCCNEGMKDGLKHRNAFCPACCPRHKHLVEGM